MEWTLGGLVVVWAILKWIRRQIRKQDDAYREKLRRSDRPEDAVLLRCLEAGDGERR